VSNPVRLVIFDCDGVLVDSERITVRIDVAVLARLGWPLTEAEVLERFLGPDGRIHGVADRGPPRPALAANWDEPFQRLYRDAFDADLKPVPAFSRRSTRSSFRPALRRAGPTRGCATRWASPGSTAASRDESSAPATSSGQAGADLFLHAADRMGVHPADCARRRRQSLCIEAARAAGMRTFGYAGG